MIVFEIVSRSSIKLTIATTAQRINIIINFEYDKSRKKIDINKKFIYKTMPNQYGIGFLFHS
jgi:hypothetical protein